MKKALTPEEAAEVLKHREFTIEEAVLIAQEIIRADRMYGFGNPKRPICNDCQHFRIIREETKCWEKCSLYQCRMPIEVVETGKCEGFLMKQDEPTQNK